MKQNMKTAAIITVSFISITGVITHITISKSENVKYEQNIEVRTNPIELKWKVKINKPK